MNIAIIGAKGVGKTTLLEAVKENISPELDFSFFDEKPLTEGTGMKSFFAYVKAYEDVIESQMRINKWGDINKKNFITEGCPLLSIAYMIIGRYETYNYNLHSCAKVNVEMLSCLSDIVTLATADFYDYDPLFYIPIEFTPDNESREEITFRFNVDVIVKSLLKQFNIKHHVVKGTEDERTEFVLRTIEKSIGEIK